MCTTFTVYLINSLFTGALLTNLVQKRNNYQDAEVKIHRFFRIMHLMPPATYYLMWNRVIKGYRLWFSGSRTLWKTIILSTRYLYPQSEKLSLPLAIRLRLGKNCHYYQGLSTCSQANTSVAVSSPMFKPRPFNL